MQLFVVGKVTFEWICYTHVILVILIARSTPCLLVRRSFVFYAPVTCHMMAEVSKTHGMNAPWIALNVLNININMVGLLMMY